MELGLDWFDADVDASLISKMIRQGNPIEGFSAKHDVETGPGVPVSSMAIALDTLESVEKYWGKEGLASQIDANREVFPLRGVKRYKEQAELAAKFLTGLRNSVQAVNDVNWPASATRRTEDQPPPCGSAP
jgi:hypothetical protein